MTVYISSLGYSCQCISGPYPVSWVVLSGMASMSPIDCSSLSSYAISSHGHRSLVWSCSFSPSQVPSRTALLHLYTYRARALCFPMPLLKELCPYLIRALPPSTFFLIVWRNHLAFVNLSSSKLLLGLHSDKQRKPSGGRWYMEKLCVYTVWSCTSCSGLVTKCMEKSSRLGMGVKRCMQEQCKSCSCCPWTRLAASVLL